MRIAIEQAIYLGGVRGVGTYVRSLVKALAEISGADEEFLLFGFFFRDFESKNKQVYYPRNPRFRPALKRWPESWVTRLEWEWGLPVIDSFCRGEGVAVYHSPATRLPHLSRAAGVITVHDLVCEVHPEFLAPQARAGWSAFSREQVSRADLVMVDSECTKRDLMERFGTAEEKIRRVYLGIDHEAFKPVEEPKIQECLRKKFALPGRYLISVGPWEERRNLETELEALRVLVSRPQTQECSLVLVGSGEGPYVEGLRRRVHELGLSERVIWTGYVSREELAGLYTMAAAYAYPSWYDGYNMPLLEAMSCGAPAIVSRAGVLPELGRDACLYFDPGSPEEMADCLSRLLTNQALAQELRKKGFARTMDFQWENTARQVLSVYREAAGGRAR
ncbi:MAG: glycosyltransferase family 4 protein [Elusimicrobia bacterium]|nr:glycosyltransferase family 4 protein [Elusimicrobiota bacterium]